MLSRIADSLYWMSRYLERADGTARLLEINLTHLLEAEDALPEAAEWMPLLNICGHEALYAESTGGSEPSAARVTEFMTRDPENPGSIRTSLRLARENARVVRDRISKETWEAMNEVWLRSEDRLRHPPGPDYFRWLRSEVARFHGLTVGTMMRGEPFGFYLLGFFLERADMTCRLLDVKYHLLLPDLAKIGSPLDYYQWAALLRSLSGFEAYRRKHHQLRPIDVAEFVVLDPDFPRSLRFAVDRMQQALLAIGPAAGNSEALGAVAELVELLEKQDAASLFHRGLHEFLTDVLDGVSRLHEALRGEYFETQLREASA